MSAELDYSAAAGYEIRDPEAPRLLLLLHGLGGDRRQPLGVLADANLDGWTVLAVDARAHGETTLVGGPETFRFPSMISDLLSLLESIGQSAKPTYVLGISMGAALALRLQLSGQLDVRGVALIRPAFSDVPEPENLRVLQDIGARLETEDTAAALDEFCQTTVYREIAEVSESGATSLRDQFTKPDVVARRVRLVEVPKNVAYRDLDELATAGVPALVIGAPADPVHPLQLARDWAAGLPQAELVEVPARDADPNQHRRATADAVVTHLRGIVW